MSFKLEMEQMPGYLAARITGVGVLEEAWRQFELITEHCRVAKNNKLLIDTTGAEAELSDMERFQLGERLGIFAHYKIKVAFVSRSEQIDSRKFAAIVAQNRGVTIDTFTDFQSAGEWLLK